MRSWIAISALALGACMAETWSPAVVDHFELVQGGAQVGTPGRPLDSLVVVRLVDDRGDPVVGAAVQWSVEAGGGSLSSSGATTGADGITTAQWDLGILGATQRLRVSHGGELSLVITAEPRTFKARSIAVGYGSGCALDDEGDLWCWGNIVRPSSDPSVPPRDPTLPVAIDSGHAFVDLVAGNDHYCALTAAGVAWCWSRGRQNETGRAPSSISPWTPAPVEGAPSFVTLGAGQLHTCGIDSPGAIWCWGSGIGFGLGGYDWRVYPVPMPAEVAFARVVGGWSHSCAVATDGGAWCWGDNSLGQLGLGGGDYYLDTPARLAIDEPISEVGAGDYHGCGRAVSGNLYCWGYPYYEGSLGYTPSEPGTTTPRLVARGQFAGLVVGWGMGMVIRSGQVALWGSLGGYFSAANTTYAPTVTSIPLGLSGVAQVSGQVHVACARLIEGEVYCWGDRFFSGWDPSPSAIPAP